MSSFKWAGSVTSGTLRTYDLISRFMEVLRDLDPEQAGRWSDNERRYLNALDGTYDKDPQYSVADITDLEEEAYDFVVTLQDKLNELAPMGYRFGVLEGDGSDYGFWPVDPADAVRDHTPEGHDELAGKRHIFYIAIQLQTKGGFVPALVYEDVAGFFPLAGNGAFASPWVWGPTYADAQRMADDANKRLGYSEREALHILMSSMAAQHAERAADGEDDYS